MASTIPEGTNTVPRQIWLVPSQQLVSNSIGNTSHSHVDWRTHRISDVLISGFVLTNVVHTWTYPRFFCHFKQGNLIESTMKIWGIHIIYIYIIFRQTHLVACLFMLYVQLTPHLLDSYYQWIGWRASRNRKPVCFPDQILGFSVNAPLNQILGFSVNAPLNVSNDIKLKLSPKIDTVPDTWIRAEVPYRWRVQRVNGNLSLAAFRSALTTAGVWSWAGQYTRQIWTQSGAPWPINTP